MKTAVAAATFILAASAFTIPGFGQKRNAVEQPVTLAAKHQARNKPINIPRNKAPARKAAARPSRPKKASTMAKPKTKPAQKKPAPKSSTSSTESEAAEDVDAEDTTVDADADKDVSETEHDTDMETAPAEHERVPRANKPKPAPKKSAPKPAPAKPAAKPATRPEPVMEHVGDQDGERSDDVEGGAEANIEPTDEVEYEEGNVEKAHPRRQAKVHASKPNPKTTAQHAKTQPKKAASQPKKAASTGKQEAQGAPFDQIATVEKTVGNKLHSRGGKPAAKKAAPKKAAPKKAAAHKSPVMAKAPVGQVDDDTPIDTVTTVAKTATSKVHRRNVPPTGDTQILQYALTLEHLENAFYHGALEKFNQQAFVKGGLPSFARKRFEQIAEHEAEHVAFLTKVLGDDAVEPCEYDFPYTDPKSFAALSMVLEGVGVSAYLGVVEFIKNADYLTAAGSILTTEARHAAWVAGAVEKEAPWSGAFDIPLSGDDVFSLAAPFIKSCPSSNPDIGVKAFPKLAVKTEDYKAGDTITLEFDDSEANGEPLFFALFNGLNVTYVEIENNDQATLPADLQGTVYGVVTTNGTAVSDETTIAGVAILDFYENF